MSLQALDMGAVARFEVLERSRVRLEQIETGIGGRAAQGVGGETVAMPEGPQPVR